MLRATLTIFVFSLAALMAYKEWGKGEPEVGLPMADKDNRWNGDHDSPRIARKASNYEAKIPGELVKAWRVVANYMQCAIGLRTRPSVLRQDKRLYKVLFRLGRMGLLSGVGQSLQDRYPPAEHQLPERLTRMLAQLEEMQAGDGKHSSSGLPRKAIAA